LLREAIDENIDSATGKPLGTTRRQRMRRLGILRRTLLIFAIPVLAALTVTAWRGFGRATPLAEAEVTVPATVHAVTQNGEAARFVDPPQPLERNVIPLAVQRIVVDAGHGGRDGGTSLSAGLNEKTLTLDIAQRLRALLETASFEVIMTRTTDETVSLKDRAALANQARADLFISVHVNWLPDRNARGVEIYYAGPTNDPFLKQLAASENRDSGYSIADYRSLLEGVYADVRREESAALAETLLQSLFETLSKENPGIGGRGVMRAPFVVLVATEMPAALAEVACLSNSREARMLSSPSYRQKIAQALFEGIDTYSRHVNPQISIAEKGAQHD
jgi:N-acetylmuramoyl-L-alanine amidase